MTDVDVSLLSKIQLPQIGENDVQKLVMPVSKEEVFNALRGMKSFNAPGSDGFQAFFFK